MEEYGQDILVFEVFWARTGAEDLRPDASLQVRNERPPGVCVCRNPLLKGVDLFHITNALCSSTHQQTNTGCHFSIIELYDAFDPRRDYLLWFQQAKTNGSMCPSSNCSQYSGGNTNQRRP